MPTRSKDFAEKETDKRLDELEEKIVKIYSQAYDELNRKFDKHVQKFAKKDEIMRQRWQNGEIEEEDYLNWRKGQLFAENRLEQMANELGEDLVNADKLAMSVANGYMPEVYALNYNWETYDIEQNTQIDTSFTLYSREAVERLEKGGRKILPKRKVDVPKDKKWNVQHLRNEITQGILQGKSIPDIAKGLRKVTDMDRRASIRNARTMMTGAQNGGRLDAMNRASDKGIKIQKEWMATLDNRTRDSHQELDGQRVGVTRYFSNGCQFPGDPNGRPEEVYNCRCTMVSFYPEYADIIGKRITYKEWAQTRGSESENEPKIESVVKPEEEKYQYDHRQWLGNVYNSNYTEEDLNELAEAYANAPEELQRFYEKYSGSLTQMEDIEGGGYFWAGDGRVHFNSTKDKEGTSTHTRFATSSHEIGHNMDWLANGKTINSYLSDKYRNKNGESLKDIIYKDWENVFIGRAKELFYDDGSVKTYTDYNDIFAKIVGRSTKKSESFMKELFRKARVATSDPDARQKINDVDRELDRLKWKGAKLSDYKQFYADNQGFFEKYAPKRWVVINKTLIDDFCKDMKWYSMQECGDLSDMFERFSIEHGGNAYPFGVGHGESYALGMGALEKEAFAEMTSATLVNKSSLDLIKQYLPNAYEAYLEMLKEAL